MAVSTITEIIRPNGDGATLEWQLSTGSTHYTLVDDVVLQPTESGTADYIFADPTNDNDTDHFHFEHPQDLHKITSITMYALIQDQEGRGFDYHLNINPDAIGWLTAVSNNTATQGWDDQAWHWASGTWSNLNLHVGQLANCQAQIQVGTMSTLDICNCAVIYLELTGYPHPPSSC